MSRHLSDRSELALFIDGLNRILLIHGDDIGIVGQALISMHVVIITLFSKLMDFFSLNGRHHAVPPVIRFRRRIHAIYASTSEGVRRV
jgi:hypothetical protein